jgi:hypothetical protein
MIAAEVVLPIALLDRATVRLADRAYLAALTSTASGTQTRAQPTR